MKYIAHRGLGSKYKQNTVESIHDAIQCGYHGIEIDVQLCKTGEIVLAHDIYLEDGFIKDMSYEDLKPRGICTLHEVYDRMPYIKDVLLLLDMKGDDVALVDSLMNFYKNRPARNVTMCSFNRKLLYTLPPYFKKGSTFECRFHHTEYDHILRGLSVVIIHWTCLDHDFISYCKRLCLPVYTYTHKTDKDLEHIRKFDIDGIITDGIKIEGGVA